MSKQFLDYTGLTKFKELSDDHYDEIKNVTWQEYEAIEDKNDDKAYFISDVPPSEQKKTAVKDLPTGAISTVNDAAELPLNALKVSVEAWQEGSGDPSPSNVRPIHGWDSGEIGVVGKNWFDKNDSNIQTNRRISTGNGSTYASSGSSVSGYIKVLEGVSYTLTTGRTAYYAWYSESAYISGGAWVDGGVLVAPTGATRIRFDYPTDNVDAVQFEISSSATTYEPYQGNQYTQQFPQTIYGAEWDVTNGPMIVTHTAKVFSGNDYLYKQGNLQQYACAMTDAKYYSASMVGDQMFDKLKATSRNALTNVTPYTAGISNNNYIYFNLPFDTVAEVNEWLAENPVTYYYELKTPTTISQQSLTPRMLQGTNNIYADCGEVIEGEYFGNNTNQIRVNDEIIAGGNSVTFAAESKYAEHAEVAEVANNIQNIDYDDYDAIVDKDNDIAYIVNDVPSSESGSNYFKDLPTGSISTVNDAAELPLNALKVSVNATQDLHGYEYPWAGGNGKNKCDNSTNIIGLYGEYGNYMQNTDYKTSALIKISPNTTYNVSLFDTNTNTRVASLVITEWDANQNIIQEIAYIDTFTTSANAQYVRIRNYGAQASVIKSGNYAYQIELGSTPTAFAPYSNICPISGWDSGEITVAGGKNKLPLTIDGVKSFNTSAMGYRWEGNSCTVFGITFELLADDNNNLIGIKATGTASGNATLYTYGSNVSSAVDITFDNAMICTMGLSGSADTYRGIIWKASVPEFLDDQPVPMTAGDTLYGFGVRVISGYAIPSGGIIFKPMVRLATETDPTFEPYQLKEYTQQFPQTIYGAEWDVVGGGMKITHIRLKPTSDLVVRANASSWNPNYPSYYFAIPDLGIAGAEITCISNAMKGVSRNQIQTINEPFACAIAGDSNEIDFTATQTSASDAKQFLLDNDVEFVYELRTPTTIPLSPLSIRLLQGTNNLYADCGEVLEGEYCTNTSNQLCINDKVVSGDRMVPQSLVSKYSDYSTHADKADDSTHADIADNACTFSVDENGLLTISLVSGDSNNSLSSTRSVKSTTTLPPEEEITNEKSEEEDIKDESVEEEPSENESGISDETENEPSVEEKDNDDGSEETPPEQNIR